MVGLRSVEVHVHVSIHVDRSGPGLVEASVEHVINARVETAAYESVARVEGVRKGSDGSRDAGDRTDRNAGLLLEAFVFVTGAGKNLSFFGRVVG